MSSEKRTLQEQMEQLQQALHEVRDQVLARVAEHFWGLLSFVVLVVVTFVLIGVAHPDWLACEPGGPWWRAC